MEVLIRAKLGLERVKIFLDGGSNLVQWKSLGLGVRCRCVEILESGDREPFGPSCKTGRLEEIVHTGVFGGRNGNVIMRLELIKETTNYC